MRRARPRFGPSGGFRFTTTPHSIIHTQPEFNSVEKKLKHNRLLGTLESNYKESGIYIVWNVSGRSVSEFF